MSEKQEKMILEKAKDLALNMIINGEFKQCKKCKQLKPLDEFYVDGSIKGLYRKSTCKDCYAEIRKVERPAYYKEKGSLLAVDDREYSNADLTLHNYKEPLTPTPNGYGYMGTITSTNDGKYIQCHICGKLYANLGGHLYAAHKMLAKTYKKEFGLEFNTALISEQERMHLKTSTLSYIKTLTDEEKEAFKMRAKQAWLEGRLQHKTTKGTKERLETKNKKGSCPDQVLSKLREVAVDIGHRPSKREFIAHEHSQRYVHLIYKLFGDWHTAIELAGLKGMSGKLVETKKELNDMELLEMVRDFVLRTREKPTKSDFNREILPSYSLYIERFGSIQQALKEAEVDSILERGEEC